MVRGNPNDIFGFLTYLTLCASSQPGKVAAQGIENYDEIQNAKNDMFVGGLTEQRKNG